MFTKLAYIKLTLHLLRNHADTDAGNITEQSNFQANDFSVSLLHRKCQFGLFILCELQALNDEKLFALIKYENEDGWSEADNSIDENILRVFSQGRNDFSSLVQTMVVGREYCCTV